MADESQRYLALKASTMPRDTNQYGTIFGGVLLSYIDQAGTISARYVVASSGWQVQPLVTVAMKSVEFLQPVCVGDVLSFWTEVVRIGTTSITVQIVVEAERDGRPARLTEAEVTYVAVELEAEQRRPVPIRGE